MFKYSTNEDDFVYPVSYEDTCMKDLTWPESCIHPSIETVA